MEHVGQREPFPGRVLTDSKYCSDVCAAFAPMVNRGDAIGWGEWRNLPIEKQMGWRIPIEVCHLSYPNELELTSGFCR